MRLWHWQLLPYLPDRQLRGQLRELVAIMHDWRDKGKTNHILINGAMCYSRAELTAYFKEFSRVYESRFGKKLADKYTAEFTTFAEGSRRIEGAPLFYGWHDRAYLRVCMANLFEKRLFGRGIARLTIDEWERLEDGYETITGERYKI